MEKLILESGIWREFLSITPYSQRKGKRPILGKSDSENSGILEVPNSDFSISSENSEI
jgi:hypothetical protein